MRPILSAAFLTLLSVCSASPESKSRLLDEVVEVQGLVEVATSAKAGLVAEAKDATRLELEQLKQNFSDLSAEMLEEVRKIEEKYAATLNAAWSVEQAMAVWKKNYGADFSEDELRQILAYAKSPLGQKELAASKRALDAWRNYISQQTGMAAEAAMKQKTEDIHRILNAAGAKKK